MGKYYGIVGYVEDVETRKSIWESKVTEREYYGDIIKNNRGLETGDSVNDTLKLNNIVSIVSDPYALEHVFAIRYVEWMGVLWKVENAEIQSPRILLSIGGVYHGPTAKTG